MALHELVDGVCTTCATMERHFDPSEPRILGGPHGGEWGHGGGIGSALKDSLKSAGKPNAAKVLEHVNDKQHKQETIDRAQAVWGGQFGALTATVTQAYGYGASKPHWLTVSGRIHDQHGNEVGEFERLLDRDDRGRPYVRHESLTMDDKVRGQGFAEQFNANAEQWYRDNGYDYVELNADIDVGGYAWARAGYTWADEDAAGEVGDRLSDTIEDYRHRSSSASPTDRAAIDAQIAAATELLRKLRTAGDVNQAPTPYEISQAGRPAGASGPGATWLGKDAMLGSDWNAVKWL